MSRITYLDSVRGVCMLMIITQHVGAYIPIPHFHTSQTAAFFLLSGMFLSVKSSFKVFLRKNVERIMLPFLFFYIVSYVLFYLGIFFVSGFGEMTEASGIFDCFVQKQYFNGPLWFLLALFWIKIMSFPIVKFVKGWARQMIFSIILGLGGFLLNLYKIDLPLAFDTALSSVPLFYFGYFIKGNGYLEKYSRVETLFFSMVCYISCLYHPISVGNSINRYDGNYAEYIYVTCVLSIAIILFSKGILNRPNLISFIGENSMWLLCTHHIVCRPVKFAFMRLSLDDSFSAYFVCVITVAICCFTIPIANKYIPWSIGKTKK